MIEVYYVTGGQMGDYFKEQIVKRKNSNMNNAISFFIYTIGGFLGFLAFAFFGGVGVVLSAIIGVGLYFLYTRQKKEFEYIITNDTLDIDVIYNKSKRKRLISINVKEVSFMTYATNQNSSEFNNVSKTLDFSSGEVNENTMYCKTIVNGSVTKVIIEPNENILDGIKKYLHSKILVLDK